MAATSTKSGSKSQQQTQSQQNTASNSTSDYGSTTNSHSETNTSSHSEGGSHSESYGKSWASGKVEDTTQAQRDKYNQDYAEGQKVTDAYNRLQETLDNKPTFQSKFENQLDTIFNQIMNRDKFNYDFNADNMYKMYKDNYTAQGQKAMQDTMGQANANTGGYGSSYSQSAGQQTYQNYLQKANDIIPTLRDEAYQQYQDEGTDLNNKYNLTNTAYNREYGQYRDNVSDYQADRSYNQSAYTDERNFDYSQVTNNRDYWNNEYWNEKNAERSNFQNTDTRTWEDTNSHSTTDATSNTSGWQNTNSNSQTNSNSITGQNSESWSGANTGYSGGSSSSGSGSSGSKTSSGYKAYQAAKTSIASDQVAKSSTPDKYIDPEKYYREVPNSGALKQLESTGIASQLEDQIKAAKTPAERQQIYKDMQNGFTYGGQSIKLQNDEIEYLQLQALNQKEDLGKSTSLTNNVQDNAQQDTTTDTKETSTEDQRKYMDWLTEYKKRKGITDPWE